ncbi:hypothetical protein BBJ28_00013057 [Nothophytophthora sp. Chile5]|nr:hypothetical protein BBJ28_00013057 [Nothophytophthora sp. Chile5]
MNSLLRKLQPGASSKLLRDSNATTASESDDSPPNSSGRDSNSRWSSSSFEELIQKVFVPSNQAESEEPTSTSSTPLRRRKRDRLRGYLTRSKRNSSGKTDSRYLRPVTSLVDKEELQSSGDTEEAEDEYLGDTIEFCSDSEDDSEDEDDGYVFPPVVIPNAYRKQDRMGGITVAGARVLFTLAAFKRQKMMHGRLLPIPEATAFEVPVMRKCEYIVIGGNY